MSSMLVKGCSCLIERFFYGGLMCLNEGMPTPMLSRKKRLIRGSLALIRLPPPLTNPLLLRMCLRTHQRKPSRETRLVRGPLTVLMRMLVRESILNHLLLSFSMLWTFSLFYVRNIFSLIAFVLRLYEHLSLQCWGMCAGYYTDLILVSHIRNF